jgi:hypothetical protein
MFNPIGIVTAVPAVARRLFQATGTLLGIAALLRRVRHALAGRRARHVLFDRGGRSSWRRRTPVSHGGLPLMQPVSSIAIAARLGGLVAIG